MAFAAVVGAVGAEHEVVDKAGEAAMLGVGDDVAAQSALGADGTEIEAWVEHEVGEADIEAGIGHRPRCCVFRLSAGLGPVVER